MRTVRNYLLTPASLFTLAATGLLLNPRPVQAAKEDAAINAVQAKVTFSLAPGVVLSGGGLPSNFVPTGKRFVIEYASAQCNLPAGQAIGFLITRFLSGAFIDHYSAMSAATPGGGLVQTGEKVLLYADSGGSLNTSVMRTSQDGTANCTVAISGHLADLQ